MRHRASLGGALLIALTLFSGCTTQVDAELGSASLPPPGRSTLDWEGVQIILPLDSYGMSTREKQIIRAAQTVVAWRCLDETDTLSDEGIVSAQAWLEWNPELPLWLFGFWNASYVAAHGVLPPTSAGFSSFPDNSAPEAVAACVARSEYQDLNIVDRMTLAGEGSLATGNLIGYAMEAHLLTEEDPRFVALVDERAQCLLDKGYKVGDYPLRAVDTTNLTAAGQRERAFVVEAECSDQMDLTQRAADLQAGYEQQFIDENQAELVAIKRIADERVVKATAILEEVGLL